MDTKLGSYCDGRSNNLDCIRFLAASLVIYSHAFPLSADIDGEILKDITDNGWDFGSLSVAVFFIISGFLISRSYDRGNDPVKYIKARVLRIFPGLFVALFLSTFVLGPVFTTLPLREYFTSRQTYQYLKSIFLYPLYWFLPGCFENNNYSPSVNGSLWTIPFEFFFYIVVLLLGILGLLKKKKASLTLFFLFVVLELYKTRLFPIEGHFFTLPRYSLIELGLYFSAGMVMYAYRDSIPLDKHYAMLSIIALAIFIPNGYYTLPFSIFGTYLIIYFAYNKKIPLNNFSKYGDFSYGIYIYGFPIQQAVVSYFGGTMNPYLNMVISYPIILLLAMLSWYFVEKPCLKWNKIEIALIDRVSRGVQSGIVIIQRITGKFLNIRWRFFIPALCVAIFAVHVICTPPSLMTFPNANDSFFIQGWLPQSSSEDYRWVQQESIVKLSQPKGTSKFILEGYVPDSFDEIGSIAILIDEKQVYEQNISPGDGISIACDIGKNESSTTKEHHIKIKFDGIHIPPAEEADLRELSALISRIGFVE